MPLSQISEQLSLVLSGHFSAPDFSEAQKAADARSQKKLSFLTKNWEECQCRKFFFDSWAS